MQPSLSWKTAPSPAKRAYKQPKPSTSIPIPRSLQQGQSMLKALLQMHLILPEPALQATKN